MQKNILVTGATGNIGSALLPLLAGSTHKIWAGSTKGQTLQGTPGRAIDFLNPATLSQAFEGIQTLFVVIPLHPQMVLMATNVANAAKAAGVTHIVRVSGAGADPQSPVAVARVQGEIDAQLKNSGIRCTFLQPKNFMQNYIQFYPGMIKQGQFYSSQGEGKIAFIDAEDIAKVAAQVILHPERHIQSAYVLTGPQALTNQEVLAMIDAATGRKTQWIGIPESAAVESMKQMGMPDFVVDVMSSLNQIIAAGYVAETTDCVQQVTGQAPRHFEDFIRTHAAVWK